MRPRGSRRGSGHAGKLARLGAATGPDELLDTGQQMRQTGAAGIDHARAPKHFELLRGFLHRVVGRFPCGRQEGGELALGRNVKCADADRAHHAQDGSLAGIAEAVAGGFRRRLQPQRNVAGVQAGFVLPGVGQSLQELRQDHARIPPRAVQGSSGRGLGHLAGAPRRGLRQRQDHGLRRVRHIQPGVAIGHRKHVDAIQFLAAVLKLQHAGGDGSRQPPPIQIVNALHRSIARSTFFPR